jgi:hypothetical protein
VRVLVTGGKIRLGAVLVPLFEFTLDIQWKRQG